VKLVDVDVPGPKRDMVGYGRRLPRVTWPEGYKVALNLVVNYEEGSEYSFPAGDKRSDGAAEITGGDVWGQEPKYRDLMVESVYEYGSRAGVWRLLRMFDEYRVKVTFFASAVALERNPEVGEWIKEAGHEPCSHGWRWIEYWKLTREEERQHIKWAVESIAKTCGQRPIGSYYRYGPSVNTRELLVEEGGFLYDADAYNDDLPYFVDVKGKQHLVVPYNSLPYNDVRFTTTYAAPSDFFETLRRGLDEYRREAEGGFPKMMSVGLHPRWAGQATRSSALRDFIEYALGKGDVWFARRSDIADWWLKHHNEFNRE
jgi:peptidoglycan/xylan/chitin deacetylase (PgdA/CDA1 family)